MGLWTVDVGDQELPDAYGIGKHVDRTKAILGAWGECAEALHNAMLYLDRYGLMTEVNCIPPDILEEIPANFRERSALVTQFLLGASNNDDATSLSAAYMPFADLAGDQLVYLPRFAVRRFCSTNGMAAGNTLQHAIAAAIFEVFERYATYLFFVTDIPLYTIDVAALHNPATKRIADNLRNCGYILQTYVLSFGKRLPVIACFLKHPNGATGSLGFGSGVTPQDAFDSAFRELLQGRSWDNLAEHQYPFPADALGIDTTEAFQRGRAEFYKAISLRTGMVSLSRFATATDWQAAAAIDTGWLSEAPPLDSVLAHCAKLIAHLGSSLLVRSVGYLGIPTVQVYIPGITELGRSTAALRSGLLKIPYIRTTLLNLGKATPQQISQTLEIIAELEAEGLSAHLDLEFLLGITLDAESPLANPPLEMYRGVAELLLLRYQDAAKHLSVAAKALKNRAQSAMLAVDMELLASYALAMLADTGTTQEITLTVEKNSHIERYHALLASVSKGETLARILGFPLCGTCAGCPVQRHCGYPLWKDRATKLSAISKTQFPDQRELFSLCDLVPFRQYGTPPQDLAVTLPIGVDDHYAQHKEHRCD